MNQGQQMFMSFILDRVELGKEETAKALLMEAFFKQDNGTFNKEYAMDFMPRMLVLIKKEHLQEVKDVMARHNS